MDDINQDEKILKHLDDNFSCKICDGVLICAKSCDCGHKFCTYCLDLLQAMTQQCPQCTAPIRTTANAPDIDKAIDNLFLSCSSDLQRGHELAKASRAQKAEERTKKFKELKKNLPHGSGAARSGKNLDEICSSLASNIANSFGAMRPTGTKISRAAQQNPSPYAKKVSKTAKTVSGISTITKPPLSGRIKSNSTLEVEPNPGLQGTEVAHLIRSCDGEAGALAIPDVELSGIDMSKAEELFEMYDVFLKLETEHGGCGDTPSGSVDIRALENIPTVHRASPNSEVADASSEIQRMRKKHQHEVETLLKEAESAIELNDFVKKWSHELEDMINGDVKVNKPEANRTNSLEISNISGHEESQDFISEVDKEKEMWKASAELILKFRESKKRNPNRRKPSKLLPPLVDDIDIDEFLTPRGTGKSGMIPQTDYDLELNELTQSRTMNKLSTSRELNGDHKDASGNNIDPRGISKSERGETIVDENFTFWKKIADCKEALNHLKDDQLTNPEAIRKLLHIQESNSSSVSVPRESLAAAGTPRVLRSRMPVTPNRPHEGPRPSTPTAVTHTTNVSTVSNPNTSQGKTRPVSANLKKKPQFK